MRLTRLLGQAYSATSTYGDAYPVSTALGAAALGLTYFHLDAIDGANVHAFIPV